LGILDLQRFGWALRVRWLWLGKTKPNKPWAAFPVSIHGKAQALFAAAITTEVGNRANTKFWTGLLECVPICIRRRSGSLAPLLNCRPIKVRVYPVSIYIYVTTSYAIHQTFHISPHGIKLGFHSPLPPTPQQPTTSCTAVGTCFHVVVLGRLILSRGRPPSSAPAPTKPLLLHGGPPLRCRSSLPTHL
jgi:hypothetical protein